MPATRTRATAAWGWPSPATSPAATAATWPSAPAPWAACAPPSASHCDGCGDRRARPSSAAVERIGLREEAPEDVVDQKVVLLLERGVRDAGHHGELLLGIGQKAKEVDEIVEGGDAVPLPAHHDGRNHDLGRVYQGQPGAHVDVGAGGHRIVERQDGVGVSFDHALLGGAGMIAIEDAVDEGLVDRTAVLGLELGELLGAFGERRAAFAGPH